MNLIQNVSGMVNQYEFLIFSLLQQGYTLTYHIFCSLKYKSRFFALAKCSTVLTDADFRWNKSVALFPVLVSYKNICILWIKITRLCVLFADVQLGMNVFKYSNLAEHSVASWQGMLSWRNWAWPCKHPFIFNTGYLLHSL